MKANFLNLFFLNINVSNCLPTKSYYVIITYWSLLIFFLVQTITDTLTTKCSILKEEGEVMGTGNRTWDFLIFNQEFCQYLVCLTKSELS